MWIMIVLSLKIKKGPFLMRFFVKFAYIIEIFADQNFYDVYLLSFYPTASATAYGQRPKFFRAEHSATAEGENCAYGPTLILSDLRGHWDIFFLNEVIA